MALRTGRQRGAIQREGLQAAGRHRTPQAPGIRRCCGVGRRSERLMVLWSGGRVCGVARPRVDARRPQWKRFAALSSSRMQRAQFRRTANSSFERRQTKATIASVIVPPISTERVAPKIAAEVPAWNAPSSFDELMKMLFTLSTRPRR